MAAISRRIKRINQRDNDWLFGDYFLNADSSDERGSFRTTQSIICPAVTEVKCYEYDCDKDRLALKHSETAYSISLQGGQVTSSDTVLQALRENNENTSDSSTESPKESGDNKEEQRNISWKDIKENDSKQSSEKTKSKRKSEDKSKPERVSSEENTKQIEKNVRTSPSNKRKRKENARKGSRKKRKKKQDGESHPDDTKEQQETNVCSATQKQDEVTLETCPSLQEIQETSDICTCADDLSITCDESQRTSSSKQQSDQGCQVALPTPETKSECLQTELPKQGKYALSSRRPKCPRSQKHSTKKVSRQKQHRDDSVVVAYDYDYFRRTWTLVSTDRTDFLGQRPYPKAIHSQPEECSCECHSAMQLTSSDPTLRTPHSPVIIPQRHSGSFNCQEQFITWESISHTVHPGAPNAASTVSVPYCECSGVGQETPTCLSVARNQSSNKENQLCPCCSTDTVSPNNPVDSGIQQPCAGQSTMTADGQVGNMNGACKATRNNSSKIMKKRHYKKLGRNSKLCPCCALLKENGRVMKKDAACSPSECNEAQTQTMCEIGTSTNVDKLSIQNNEVSVRNTCDVGVTVAKESIATACQVPEDKQIETKCEMDTCMDTTSCASTGETTNIYNNVSKEESLITCVCLDTAASGETDNMYNTTSKEESLIACECVDTAASGETANICNTSSKEEPLKTCECMDTATSDKTDDMGNTISKEKPSVKCECLDTAAPGETANALGNVSKEETLLECLCVGDMTPKENVSQQGASATEQDAIFETVNTGPPLSQENLNNNSYIAKSCDELPCTVLLDNTELQDQEDSKRKGLGEYVAEITPIEEASNQETCDMLDNKNSEPSNTCTLEYMGDQMERRTSDESPCSNTVRNHKVTTSCSGNYEYDDKSGNINTNEFPTKKPRQVKFYCTESSESEHNEMNPGGDDSQGLLNTYCYTNEEHADIKCDSQPSNEEDSCCATITDEKTETQSINIDETSEHRTESCDISCQKNEMCQCSAENLDETSNNYAPFQQDESPNIASCTSPHTENYNSASCSCESQHLSSSYPTSDETTNRDDHIPQKRRKMSSKRNSDITWESVDTNTTCDISQRSATTCSTKRGRKRSWTQAYCCGNIQRTHTIATSKFPQTHAQCCPDRPSQIKESVHSCEHSKKQSEMKTSPEEKVCESPTVSKPPYLTQKSSGVCCKNHSVKDKRKKRGSSDFSKTWIGHRISECSKRSKENSGAGGRCNCTSKSCCDKHNPCSTSISSCKSYKHPGFPGSRISTCGTRNNSDRNTCRQCMFKIDPQISKTRQRKSICTTNSQQENESGRTSSLSDEKQESVCSIETSYESKPQCSADDSTNENEITSTNKSAVMEETKADNECNCISEIKPSPDELLSTSIQQERTTITNNQDSSECTCSDTAQQLQSESDMESQTYSTCSDHIETILSVQKINEDQKKNEVISDTPLTTTTDDKCCIPSDQPNILTNGKNTDMETCTCDNPTTPAYISSSCDCTEDHLTSSQSESSSESTPETCVSLNGRTDTGECSGEKEGTPCPCSAEASSKENVSEPPQTPSQSSSTMTDDEVADACVCAAEEYSQASIPKTSNKPSNNSFKPSSKERKSSKKSHKSSSLTDDDKIATNYLPDQHYPSPIVIRPFAAPPLQTNTNNIPNASSSSCGNTTMNNYQHISSTQHAPPYFPSCGVSDEHKQCSCTIVQAPSEPTSTPGPQTAAVRSSDGAQNNFNGYPVVGQVTGTMSPDGTIILDYNSLCAALVQHSAMRQWAAPDRHQEGPSVCKSSNQLPTIPETTTTSCTGLQVDNFRANTTHNYSHGYQPMRQENNSGCSCWLKVDVVPSNTYGTSSYNSPVHPGQVSTPSSYFPNTAFQTGGTGGSSYLPQGPCSTQPTNATGLCSAAHPRSYSVHQTTLSSAPCGPSAQSPTLCGTAHQTTLSSAPCGPSAQSPTLCGTVHQTTLSSAPCGPSAQSPTLCGTVHQTSMPCGSATTRSVVPSYMMQYGSSTGGVAVCPTSYQSSLPQSTVCAMSPCGTVAIPAPCRPTPACEKSDACRCSLSCASQRPTEIRIVRDNASPGVACALDWSLGNPSANETWETESTCNYKPFSVNRTETIQGQCCPRNDYGHTALWETCPGIDAITNARHASCQRASAVAASACDLAAYGTPSHVTQKTLYRISPNTPYTPPQQHCRTPNSQMSCGTQQCCRKSLHYRSPQLQTNNHPFMMNRTLASSYGIPEADYIAIYREFKYPQILDSAQAASCCARASDAPRSRARSLRAMDAHDAYSTYRPTRSKGRSASQPFLTGNPGASYNSRVSKSRKCSAGSERQSITSRRSDVSRSMRPTRDISKERSMRRAPSVGKARQTARSTLRSMEPKKSEASQRKSTRDSTKTGAGSLQSLVDEDS